MMFVRRIAVASTVLLATGLLAACGGEESDEAPEISIAAGPGSFTPEEQEVVDAVDAYYSAFYGRGEGSIEAVMDGKLTDELAGRLIPDETAFSEDKDLQYIGEHELDPEQVTIDGDAASFSGCIDTSKVFLVKAGTTRTGSGSIAVDSSNLDIELLREDGRWLISQPTGEEASC